MMLSACSGAVVGTPPTQPPETPARTPEARTPEAPLPTAVSLLATQPAKEPTLIAPEITLDPTLAREPVLAIVTAGDVDALVAAIIEANDEARRPGVDAIVLAGGVFSLGAAHPAGGADGPTGLPSIESQIRIFGNGAVIERSADSAAEFRILHVAEGGLLALHELTIQGGAAPAYPGGGGLLNRGEVELVNCTIRDNHNTGLYNFNGTLQLVNSTLSGNQGILGGGVFNHHSDTGSGTGLIILNSTISDNQAGSGGGIYNFIGSVVLTNTLLASQIAGGDCAGNPITSMGHNLDSDGSCGLGASGDLPGADAKLGPLGDHGGSTATHPLLTASPALDAGDDQACPQTDQRGAARPSGDHCDIGAYELDPLFP
jgi:hypothetical protein